MSSIIESLEMAPIELSTTITSGDDTCSQITAVDAASKSEAQKSSATISVVEDSSSQWTDADAAENQESESRKGLAMWQVVICEYIQSPLRISLLTFLNSHGRSHLLSGHEYPAEISRFLRHDSKCLDDRNPRFFLLLHQQPHMVVRDEVP